jgi:hypothetical protein
MPPGEARPSREADRAAKGGWHGEKLVLVAAMAAGCTYRPSFDDCAVACRTSHECPNEMICSPEGYCRLDGATASCAGVLADAGVVGPPNAHCTGTAMTCATPTSSNVCTDIHGCAWTNPACKLTTDCTLITTNQQCMDTPGCATDFATSTCQPVSGYCTGSTKSACQANDGCTFTGGCAGTATACDELASQTTCQTQAGCSWH